MRPGPFSPRTAAVLGAILAVALLSGLSLLIWGDRVPRPDSAAARRVLTSASSPAATGFLAFRRMLEDLGISAVPSRFHPGRRAGDHALLVILAPGADPRDPRAEGLSGMLEAAGRALLVLPKYRPSEDPVRPGWAGEETSPLPLPVVSEVLDRAGIEGTVLRSPEARFAPSLFPVPELEGVQLVRSPVLSPLVRTAEGILLGRLRKDGRSLLVLSDPDVLSNLGLHRGANGRFAAALVERAGGGRRVVILDETLHGLFAPAGPFDSLLRFPLLIVLLQVGTVVLFLVWAGTGRFGPPLPEEEGLAPGKETLVRNTADLLLRGGHSAAALDRYFRHVLARASGGEVRRGRQSLLDQLSSRGERREVRRDIRALAEEVGRLRASPRADPGRVLATAREIALWEKEFRNGTE